jgi:hypothetical protein
MCRRDNSTKTKASSTNNRSNVLKRNTSSSFLLLTHDSFVFPELEEPQIDKDDANKRKLPNNKTNNSDYKNPHIYGLGGPTLYATLATVVFYVALLFLIEHGTKIVLRHYASHIPILNESPHNVGILARHLSVDFLSLLVCAYIAISNRHVCSEIIHHFLISMGKKKEKQSSSLEHNTSTTMIMHESGYEERIFKYHPGAQRLITFFLVYQVKNLYDTLYWNDGIEFVLHHLFAGAAAW